MSVCLCVCVCVCCGVAWHHKKLQFLFLVKMPVGGQQSYLLKMISHTWTSGWVACHVDTNVHFKAVKASYIPYHNKGKCGVCTLCE